jgi:predicted ATPase
MHLNCAIPRAFGRDFASAAPDAQALFDLAEQHRLDMYRPYARFLLSWIELETTPPTEDALRAGERAVAELSSLGSRIHLPLFKSVLALGLARIGQHERALREIDRAIGESEDTKQGWCAAELLRMRGDVLLCAGGVGSAAQASRGFEQALTLARSRGARLWELRAAGSLARLRATCGERRAARELLAPVYARFGEGFGSADLIDAKALLDALREPPDARVTAAEGFRDLGSR